MEPERAAASLAMQSHHILFWSSRLRLSTLAPARRQDLPLDAIQTKNLIPLSTALPVTPSSRGRQELFFHLSSPSPFLAMKTELLEVLTITLTTFFVFKFSLLTASVDIISAHANDEDRGGGGSWIHPSSSSLIIFFSLGAEGVVCPAETVRNPGHGVSLGKQRPGQQGFADYSEISGGSSTLLGLLFLIVHSPF